MMMRRQQYAAQPQYVAEEDMAGDDYYSGSEDYSYVDEEADNVVVRTQTPVRTVVPEADMGPERHLSADDFNGVQKIIVDIDLMASPEELAMGTVSNKWSLLPHLQRLLKQNLATTKRHQATDDQLAGDLKLCLPLGFEILEHANSMPFPVQVRAPGMMNVNLHRHGAALWRVQPGTAPTMVNRHVFEPTDKVTAAVYRNHRMCTPADLDEDIRWFPGNSKGAKPYGTVAVGTVAYDMLCDNLERGAWQSELPELDLDAIFSAPARHTRAVEVTETIAKQLRERLEPEVNALLERCLNLEDMQFTIERADGVSDFNSPKNFVGEMINSESGPIQGVAKQKLLQRQLFHVKGELSYLLTDGRSQK